MRTAIRLLPNKKFDECVPRQRSFAAGTHRRASAGGRAIVSLWLWRPLALAIMLSAMPAHAQRMQFATPIDSPALGAPGPTTASMPSSTGYTGSPGWVPASSSRNSSTAWGNGYAAASPQGPYGQSYGAQPGSYPSGGYSATAAPNNYGSAAAPGGYLSGTAGSGAGSWPSAPALLPSQGGAASPAAGYGASPYTAPASSYGAPSGGYGTPSTGYGATSPGYGAPAGGYAAPASPYGGTGAMGGSPAAPYASPSPAAPYGYPNPAAHSGFGTPAPYGTGPSTPPNALLDGTVYGPPPQWDPWAPPSTAPPSLLPYDPYYSPAATAPGLSFMGSAQRFLRMLELDYVWMPGKGAKEMGVNDIDASATFNIPFLYNSQTPLMITPGFGTTLFSGPSSPAATEVPPHVFDAYLESGWNPQLTQWFGGELSFRVGVHSDFEKVVSDSIRYQAKGLAVLNFSPSIKVKAGVWYLDRVHLKLLPAGGIVWIPNNDVVLQLTFPDPKISRRLSTVGTTEWWIYGRGEYGGDVWTTNTPARGVQLFDYNDIRAGLGLEFFRPAGLHGAFEVGVAFDREVYFRNDPRLHLDPCVYLRGLLTY